MVGKINRIQEFELYKDLLNSSSNSDIMRNPASDSFFEKSEVVASMEKSVVGKINRARLYIRLYNQIKSMALSKSASQPVRKLNKMGDMTYSVTLPKDYIKNLGWQQYQKLRVTQEGHKIIIEDWEG